LNSSTASSTRFSLSSRHYIYARRLNSTYRSSESPCTLLLPCIAYHSGTSRGHDLAYGKKPIRTNVELVPSCFLLLHARPSWKSMFTVHLYDRAADSADVYKMCRSSSMLGMEARTANHLINHHVRAAVRTATFTAAGKKRANCDRCQQAHARINRRRRSPEPSTFPSLKHFIHTHDSPFARSSTATNGFLIPGYRVPASGTAEIAFEHGSDRRTLLSQAPGITDLGAVYQEFVSGASLSRSEKRSSYGADGSPLVWCRMIRGGRCSSCR
jgi:hypothetical protein